MENVRVKEILGDSFISKYLQQEEITDISFNGTSLWIQHNLKGRMLADKQPSIQEVKRLIKRITDYQNTELTNSEPRLNTEIGFLRVNAMHEVISPDGMTFAIRISRPRFAIRSINELIKSNIKSRIITIPKVDKTKINKNPIENLLKVLIKAKNNIVISGMTGTGKTELQKLLVGFMNKNDKITLIEDTRDSHIKALYPDLDINSWKTVPNKFSMSDGVEEALRNNPDWIIVAETRGVEASNVLDAVKTDHHIITTLHATGAMNIPSRFIPMIKRSPEYQTMSEQLLGKDITQLLRFGIHLRAEFFEGRIVRSIAEIVEFTGFDESTGGAKGNYLYQNKVVLDEKNQTYKTVENYGLLSDRTLDELKSKRLYHLIPDLFIPKKVEKGSVEYT